MNPNSLAIDFALDSDGWCRHVARDTSSNFDQRPDDVDISLLVIHNISLPAGRFGGPHVADLFCNRLNYDADPSFEDLRGVRVSAHFLIGRDGTVTQFVSAGVRAWHAGHSSFAGRSNCNDFSIGIELEGSDATPFDDRQYQVLSSLTLALQAPASAYRCGRARAYRTRPQDRSRAVFRLDPLSHVAGSNRKTDTRPAHLALSCIQLKCQSRERKNSQKFLLFRSKKVLHPRHSGTRISANHNLCTRYSVRCDWSLFGLFS